MVARSARDVFGYGVRLFGYLLVSVLLGGALIAGGVGTIVTLEPGVVFGNESPGSYAPVAAGGALAAVGGLVLVAGVFATVFALISDAVAAGLETAETTDTRVETEPADGNEGSPQGEPAGESDTDTGEESPHGQQAEREPSPEDPFGEREGDPLAGGGTGDPLAGEPEADGPPTDRARSDDPLASGNESPAATPEETKTEAGDDRAAWKQEIKSELDDEPTSE